MELLALVAPILSTTFTIVALVVGFFGYFYGPYWGVRKVPGPPTMPLVGHIPLLVKHGPDVFPFLAKRYGPIFRFHLGRQPLVVIADAELCREVGIRKFKYISNRSIPSPIAGSPLHQKGLFFTRGTRWSTMRNTVLSLYQPSHLAKLVPSMQEYIESATQALASKDFTFSDMSLKLATDVIGQAAFGVDFGLSKPKSSQVANGEKDEVQEFIDQHMYSTTQLKMDTSGSLSIIIGLLIPFLQEPFRQILMRIPGTMDWKVERTKINLTSRLNEIVEKRMKENDLDKKDFLSLVHRARESDTNARNVIKESMRFYTVSPLVARETSADVNIGGCVLPKGTWVWLALGVLAKDPKNFPEPEKFKPERFDPNGDEEKLRHP